MKSLTKTVLIAGTVGFLTFAATFDLIRKMGYQSEKQMSLGERIAYGTVVGGMAMVLSPLLNYRTEEKNEETYNRLL